LSTSSSGHQGIIFSPSNSRSFSNQNILLFFFPKFPDGYLLLLGVVQLERYGIQFKVLICSLYKAPTQLGLAQLNFSFVVNLLLSSSFSKGVN